MSASKLSPRSPDWRPQGISITTLVAIDVRESFSHGVWEAKPGAMTSNKRSARAVIESPISLAADGPIYVHGENLEQIAAWFEQAAADIRSRKGMPS